MVSTLPGLSVSFDFEWLCHSAASRPEVNPVETLFGAPINGSLFHHRRPRAGWHRWRIDPQRGGRSSCAVSAGGKRCTIGA